MTTGEHNFYFQISFEAKADVSKMVENLREVFRERINALEWMSDVVHPDEWKKAQKTRPANHTSEEKEDGRG